MRVPTTRKRPPPPQRRDGRSLSICQHFDERTGFLCTARDAVIFATEFSDYIAELIVVGCFEAQPGSGNPDGPSLKEVLPYNPVEPEASPPRTHNPRPWRLLVAIALSWLSDTSIDVEPVGTKVPKGSTRFPSLLTLNPSMWAPPEMSACSPGRFPFSPISGAVETKKLLWKIGFPRSVGRSRTSLPVQSQLSLSVGSGPWANCEDFRPWHLDHVSASRDVRPWPFEASIATGTGVKGLPMSVFLNHTIVWCRDKKSSARYLTEILGLDEAKPFGPFMVVELANGVSMDFHDYYESDKPIASQHYAFLVSEHEFDEIFERIRSSEQDYWADPGLNRLGEINHNDGGRGTYFHDPDGHLLEIITRPYGSGD